MASKNYWRERELNHIENQLKDDKKIASKIKRNHNRAMKEIEKDIESFYGRYASKEGITMEDARKRVAKTNVNDYKAKAKRYVKEKNFTQLANEEMRLYNVTMRVNRLELLKADVHLELVAMTSEEQRMLLDSMTESARKEFERQSGILGETINHNEKMLKDIVNSSFQNATWSDRLWANQQALMMELDQLLNKGMIQGLNPRELARDLRKSFDTSVYNSERLMRTEMARVQTDVFIESMEQADVKQYVWIAEPDACEYCAALDGKLFELKDMRIGVDGVPKHPNCRCAMASYVERE